jgi:[glutamine synthetase] adenylyltransferase / [glutamine synthetase]-adenylyl-L-tyrosine phosphorylase
VQPPVWQKAADASADPRRARHFFNDLAAAGASEALASAPQDQITTLAALFAGSQALSDLLVAHPDWLDILNPDSLKHPRHERGLRREVGTWLKRMIAAQDYSGAFTRLREFKQREMLRIAARDLARLDVTAAIILELSSVADVCLDAVFQLCWAQLSSRLGRPYHPDPENHWQPTTFAVLGLGKLGGQELNYSSDVDLLFVYTEEGQVFQTPPRRNHPPGKSLSNHQFFQRLIESYVGELTRLAPEGSLYRVDLRLRPEGQAGPLARSLASYESYYAQWGQTWERMMLIKARPVAGDPALAAEFIETIQPFRYPRSIGDRILREVSEMKARIENEVVRVGEIDRNVKLGRGGIREVEFTAQTLQVLHAGRIPFLQTAQTRTALDKLVEYQHVSADDAAALREAYLFLRDVEHRLQMENNLQTHVLPGDRPERERLALIMGCSSLRIFDQSLRRHTRNVRRIYDNLLKVDVEAPAMPVPREFDGFEAAWQTILTHHSFKQVNHSLRLLETFVQGPGYVHVSPRTIDMALQLVLRFLELCPRQTADGNVLHPKQALSDPDRVMARIDSYVAAYGARSTLYEAWAANPTWFELLLLLFDRSEFLAEIAIRTPDLIEDLVESGQLRRRKSAQQILDDLQHGRDDEDQRLWLRRYHQAELMRIGLREILGLADFEQNLIELTGLADACLQYALEIVLRRHRLKRSPFAIIGLGKLGGVELTYGSDLDIMFVARPTTRNLPALQRLAAELMELLSSPTEFGVAFLTDARLRPDGEKGLLVNTLDAHERYYRQRAMLWEIQAISRSRPIAGDLNIGQQFLQLSSQLANFNPPNLPLSAYSPDWKREIARMRARVQRERTPPGKDPLAIKTGHGGLMDVEFIAQTLCLEHGWHEPNTLHSLERARTEGVLSLADADTVISNYRKLRRIEGILRRWSFAGETVLPDDPAPLYRVAVRCGYPDAPSFMNAVGDCRNAIRNAYHLVLPRDSEQLP